jgi:hypothetical protein
MEEDEQPSDLPSSAQSKNPSQPGNTPNDKPPSNTPLTAPPKTPQTSNDNIGTTKAATVTPSSSTDPDTTTKTKSSLKPSSYGKSSNTNPDHPILKAQELLDLLNSTSDDGLEYNVDGETVFANLILEPKMEFTHGSLLPKDCKSSSK